MTQVLADTGPLVALFNPRDRFHHWARARFAEFTEPLITCEVVIAEALFLSVQTPGACARLLALWERDLLQIDFSAQEQKPAVQRLLHKYADRPISLADASLVRMSELRHDCVVWTMDGDFTIYRRNGRQVIPVMMPDR